MRTHIAILKRRYLNYILAGQKKLECRLTKVRFAPFNQIAPGEQVLLKQSAGPIRGQAVVKAVRFFDNLTPTKIQKICNDYNGQIMGAEDFWRTRQDCRYCTLIWLENVKKIAPYRIKTKGMRAWLISETMPAPVKKAGKRPIIAD